MPAEPLVRTVGVESSICLLDMPWMAIWPAARPRIEGMTVSRYGPTGTWRWLAGLAPAGVTWFWRAVKGLLPELVELALEEPKRVGIGQPHQALVLLLGLGGEIGQVDRDAGDRGGEAIGLRRAGRRRTDRPLRRRAAGCRTRG